MDENARVEEFHVRKTLRRNNIDTGVGVVIGSDVSVVADGLFADPHVQEP
ncbi:hypothetical protein [Nocardia sp. NPDC051463]